VKYKKAPCISAGGLFFSLSAFGVAADSADGAAAFVFHDASAFGAGSFVEHRRLDELLVPGDGQVALDRLGHRVGAGEDLVVAKAGGRMAGDSQELLHDRLRLHAASPGQGNHAADRFALGGGAAAGFPHGGEDFEEAA
jgi:hypothetical protein